MKVYRCGYCGQPTNSDGVPLSLDECNAITEDDLKEATLVHGMCCAKEWCDNIPEKRIINVTRDMAIDAGDLSLEGEEWIW